MQPASSIPPARDKLLFTPGPLTTSATVKEAMLHDAGSWHYEFNARVKWIRERLLQLAGVREQYEAILMQGSGTFGVEAVFSSCVPRDGKVAVLANGAYGERMVTMLQMARIEHCVLRVSEERMIDPGALERELARDPLITHVAAVHSETTTGIINPIAEVGAVVRRHQRSYIVDAMSSFGGVPIDLEACAIDYLISSANKCLEGVPGFSFVLARRSALLACAGYARSLSLDLLGQWQGFEKNGQFRFTPPTHSLLAFERALQELEAEGGIMARAQRYQRNHHALQRGMQALGFRSYLDAKVQGYLITSFHFPGDPRFTFDQFYRQLSDKGYLIYPGKISQVDLFRIATIGRLFEADFQALTAAIGQIVTEAGWQIR